MDHEERMITIQYLEDRPELAHLPVEDVRARLRAALDCLPIAVVILGWNVPERLLAACAEETSRGGAKLYRWHPLLTGSQGRPVPLEWQTVGLNGEPVPGFRGLAEFTFFCPNCTEAADAALEHFQWAIRDQRYAGVFLDRIRFPSPAANLERWLACFCPGCQRAAADEGLDLPGMRRQIQALLADPGSMEAILRLLFNPRSLHVERLPELGALEAFLSFRARSVTRFVGQAAGIARAAGLEIGLDCFSPGLMGLVGQDLAALDPLCDWIKVMTYGHAFGPAALPYELTALALWLVERYGLDEAAALNRLSQGTGLPLPTRLSSLVSEGLAPQALGQEVCRARGATRLLAGMELVEVPGVVQLNPAQIASDLRSFLDVGVDGLALSWDLSCMPLERLAMVRDIFLCGR